MFRPVSALRASPALCAKGLHATSFRAALNETDRGQYAFPLPSLYFPPILLDGLFPNSFRRYRNCLETLLIIAQWESKDRDNIHEEIEHHKNDQLQKQKDGKGHWKGELASQSEAAVRLSNSYPGCSCVAVDCEE